MGSTADRRSWAPVGVVALLTSVCAVLLPFAPVEVSSPVVRWPVDPAAPQPTLLMLTAYRPLDLDVRFGCAAARAAQAVPGGVVVSTDPSGPAGTGGTGLLITAEQNRVRVRVDGRLLLDDPLPPGSCAYRVTGTSGGRPVDAEAVSSPHSRLDSEVPLRRAEPDAARFAGPAEASLAIDRDGVERVRVSAARLPEVAALVTGIRSAGPADAPSVTLRVDDEASSSPSPLKLVLVGLVVVGLLATLVLLVRIDRAGRSEPRAPPRWVAPRAVDVLVPAAMLVWLLVAPATDDDGWFATQARTAAVTGDVGAYFHLYDQSYTPFTWVYHGLGWWQQVAGYGPVVQRVPAVVAGLLTWLVVRRTGAMLAEQAGSTPAAARLLRGALAVVFLAWWLPYDMGVRPEAVVALCSAAALHGVLVAVRRGRAAAAWGACAVAGAGFVAHPGGVVVLAPLLVAASSIYRACGPVRTAAAASGGATALLFGFADGSLRDFLRSRLVALSVSLQDGWADEFQRYAFLLDQMPMGSYAKRAAVLACLVGLGWFGALALVSRARAQALPAALTTAGAATALGFVLLCVTPSKWTHHFGALAGLGTVFLGGLLVLAVPLARRAVGPLPLVVRLLAAVSAVGVVALAWNGPNSWPYAWLGPMHSAYRPPDIAGIDVGGLLPWTVLAVLVAGGLAYAGRDTLAAAPAVTALSLALSAAYLLATFGSAAAAGTPRDSLWARASADPTGRGCAVADAVEVLDPRGATPLPAAGAPAPPAGIVVPGTGLQLPNAPPVPAGIPMSGTGPGAGRGGNEPTGRTGTGWYTLPRTGTPVVVAAGSLADGNTLVARYADSRGVDLGAQSLTDGASATHWRTLVLRPPPRAGLVRLEAEDVLAGPDGRLAFSAPLAATAAPLRSRIPPGDPVALGWQIAFGFPCQRPATIAHGITEPPRHAVVRAAEPLDGLAGLAWQSGRGGAFAQVPRTQSVLQLATVGPADPYLQVYAFGSPLARDAYLLDTTSTRTVAGASTAVR